MVAEYIFLYEEKLCHRKRMHDFAYTKSSQIVTIPVNERKWQIHKNRNI